MLLPPLVVADGLGSSSGCESVDDEAGEEHRDTLCFSSERVSVDIISILKREERSESDQTNVGGEPNEKNERVYVS
jgi:hypothetical protein